MIVSTIIISLAAAFGGWKLYFSRNQAIAPTAPKPGSAQEVATTCTASFTVAALPVTPSPTSPSPSVRPTPSPSPSPSSRPSPAASPSPTPEGGPVIQSPSPSPSSSPKVVAQAIPKASPKVSPSPVPQLPVAGVSIPSIAAIGSGIILLVVGALLAF